MKRLVDNSGEPIYFKEPYFDKAMRRPFNSKMEKYEFMKANNIVERGDSFSNYKKEVKHAYEKEMDEKRRK